MSRTFKAIGVAVAAVGSTPLIGFAGERPPPCAIVTDPTDYDVAPGMADAMRRDRHLDDFQIATRLRTEAAAPAVERRLKTALGTRFVGAWIPTGFGRLTVAVTAGNDAVRVREEGAEAKIVGHSRPTRTNKIALDRNHNHATADIHGCFVDVATNSLVVSARRGKEHAAEAFVKGSGVDRAVVRVAAEAPHPAYDIRGGNQYVINGNTRCSVGFSVAGGFVSAGRCGATGSPTLGHNNVSQGTFADSSIAKNDYSWIRTNADWTSRPWVNNYSGGNVQVARSQDAAIGSSICRSGRTTGWRCGTLQGRDETVNYSAGAVYGLSRMSACAEPGDSGGSVISGNQEQGVTSGVTGNCTSGGTTWFQPVNEILSKYGLSLTTSGGTSGNRLSSNYNDKCLDVPGFNFIDGQRLDLCDCNNGSNQNWEFTGGTLRTQKAV